MKPTLHLKNTLATLVLLAPFIALSQGTWQQKGAHIPGTTAQDNLGVEACLSASGTTMAVSSALSTLKGQVKVFTWNGSTWQQKGANLNGDANGDFFGRSISLDSTGNTIAVGGPYNDAGQGSMSVAGHVKVYSWSGSAWQQKGNTLQADSPGINFGASVSISYDGKTLAVGIPFTTDSGGIGRGAVKIYRYVDSSSTWVQTGNTLWGKKNHAIFGAEVCLNRSGNIVAIGAPFHSDSVAGPEVGMVQVYSYNNTTWSKVGNDIFGDSADYSGSTLSLSAAGNRVAIGSPQDIINGGYGKARVYELSGNTWSQMGSNLVSSLFYDGFANAISLSGNGNKLAVGASTNVTGNESGRATVYQWSGTAWLLHGDTIKGVNTDDQAGGAVSLPYNGDRVAVGAAMHAANGMGSGHTRVFDYCVQTTSAVNITACSGSYNSPSGKYTWTINGTYKDTIPNSGGCDSIITINLTIGTALVVNLGADISQCANLGSVTLDAGNPGSTYLWSNNDTTQTTTVNTSGTYHVKVTKSGCSGYDTVLVTIKTMNKTFTVNNNVLTASDTLATCQWLDCNNNKQPIAGADKRTITILGCAGNTYNYTVMLSRDGCIDTADCQSIALNYTPRGDVLYGEDPSDQSGYAVSISADGNTLAIGAPYNGGSAGKAGHVRVYSWNGTAWTQKGADIDGEAENDESGSSVSLSADGNTLAIGAPFNDGNGLDAGHVRVYVWNGSAWTKKGTDIDGEGADDQSGYSVSLSADGNTLAIGAPYNNGNFNNAGHVRVYVWNGTAWTQRGADIDGEAYNDGFGFAVSFSADGNTLAIGAPYNDGNGSYAGHARIYSWNGTSWAQKGADIDGEADDRFGFAVSLSADGNTLAVGAPFNIANGITKGNARVYMWNGTSWAQKGADIDGEASSDRFGNAISLSADGNILAVGGPSNDGNGTESGHVRAYMWNGTSWVQKGADIDGDVSHYNVGGAVSFSADGKTLAMGAKGIGTNKGGNVRVYVECMQPAVGVEKEPLTPVSKNNFTVYPNPGNGIFSIKANGQNHSGTIAIYNIMGQMVYNGALNDNSETNISLSNEPSGMYFVNITTHNGTQTLRVILQHQ